MSELPPIHAGDELGELEPPDDEGLEALDDPAELDELDDPDELSPRGCAEPTDSELDGRPRSWPAQTGVRLSAKAVAIVPMASV